MQQEWAKDRFYLKEIGFSNLPGKEWGRENSLIAAFYFDDFRLNLLRLSVLLPAALVKVGCPRVGL